MSAGAGCDSSLKIVESREETSKYTDLMPDGRARKWTWVMDAKSVITSPSPQVPIRHGKGPLVISGLAWSGNGRVTRVDVSLDGGRNWTEALKIATGRKGKALFLPLRLALTGEDHGPDLVTLLPLIGREKAAERLRISAGAGA